MMVFSDRQLTIREVQGDDEFGAWLREIVQDDPVSGDTALQESQLVLTDEIGDWIGGVRYTLRGGVAHLLEIAVCTNERGRGHALRLLEGFESAAREHDAHVIEFWTENLGLEPLLAALGWELVVARPAYIGGRTWYLMEKRLAEASVT